MLELDPYTDVGGVGSSVWVNFYRQRWRADDFMSTAVASQKDQLQRQTIYKNL